MVEVSDLCWNLTLALFLSFRSSGKKGKSVYTCSKTAKIPRVNLPTIHSCSGCFYYSAVSHNYKVGEFSHLSHTI